jgi:hypothetical protein
MARETSNSGSSSCGVFVSSLNVILLIVAAALEGKLSGAPTCQHDMTVMAITFAVLYGTCGVCACCIGLLVASLNTGGKCCALLFLIALMVGPGVAGLVVTHSAACSDYDGEFLWVVIVVNGSMSVAFAGLALIAAVAPVCLFILSGEGKASSAAAASAITTTTSASVVPGMPGVTGVVAV